MSNQRQQTYATSFVREMDDLLAFTRVVISRIKIEGRDLFFFVSFACPLSSLLHPHSSRLTLIHGRCPVLCIPPSSLSVETNKIKSGLLLRQEFARYVDTPWRYARATKRKNAGKEHQFDLSEWLDVGHLSLLFSFFLRTSAQKYTNATPRHLLPLSPFPDSPTNPSQKKKDHSQAFYW